MGVGGLAGVALGAAVGLGVAVGVDRGVSDGSAAGVTVLGVDVAASMEVGIVATASPGVGVWFPQASRAVRIAMVTMRNEIFT